MHVRLALEPSEHVIGFGERFDALDQRGRSLDAVVFEQYKGQAAAGRTYLPMPFAHVVPEDPDAVPWGFHVATSRRTWYDVGRAVPGELRITAALGGTPEETLDLHLYSGEPAEVARQFTAEVGTAEELPSWVLRLWASGNEWNSQDAVMERMDQHAELDIPLGAVVIEAWSDEQGFAIFNDATYDVTPDAAAHDAADMTYPPEGLWPDPSGMIAELHARDIKVLLWQIPLQKTRHDLPDDVPDDAQVLVDGRAIFMDMLPELVEEGRRVLLFSQFTSMLALIEQELVRAKLDYVTLTGDTKDRDTPIRRFQSEEVPIFLVSLKAGGLGLNLTAADTVIHFDPWWNPAVENQATDRAHRIGQTKRVFVYKLIVAGSIEEKILALQEKKAALAHGILSADRAGEVKFSESDLAALLAPLPPLRGSG